ncbi:MAG: nucleotidyltransferase domain-containing protein [Clostridiales bacterium]|nr:nucleotidyltransferase domain-containing protein [Clostridiales bacterium]
MNTDLIFDAVKKAAENYPIKRVVLFGSQANGTATENSDVDLIVEFSRPVTLITIAMVKQFLEELLGKSVDVIHGPMQPTDLLDIDKEIEIYAA